MDCQIPKGHPETKTGGHFITLATAAKPKVPPKLPSHHPFEISHEDFSVLDPGCHQLESPSFPSGFLSSPV